jgi:hypothetical protein
VIRNITVDVPSYLKLAFGIQARGNGSSITVDVLSYLKLAFGIQAMTMD